MKIRRFIPKQKLQATARRLPQRAAMEDFQEPTMSFVKALIVVVLLHLVAVGGIFAFESVKKAHKTTLPDSMLHPAKDSAASDESQNASAALKNGDATKPVADVSKMAETTHKKTAEEATAKAPARETAPPVKDSGEVYTVVKGDNPVVIARRFHVNYDELLKINKIEDPKKLRIGQKLRIPAKRNQ